MSLDAFFIYLHIIEIHSSEMTSSELCISETDKVLII